MGLDPEKNSSRVPDPGIRKAGTDAQHWVSVSIFRIIEASKASQTLTFNNEKLLRICVNISTLVKSSY
jgi:hypothetical protein